MNNEPHEPDSRGDSTRAKADEPTAGPDSGAAGHEERLAEILAARHERLLAASEISESDDLFQALAAGDSASDSLASLAALDACLRRVERVRRDMALQAANIAPAEPSPHAEPLGRIGRFEIEGELGRGGLGIVLLARDPVLRRRVALKIPRPEALLTRDLRKRFQREGEAAARLTHPNIVPVYEIGEAGPFCYIASEYVVGQSLAQWLHERREPAPIELAARIVAELAAAMHYAHGKGVLHRDLKPSNVIIESPPAEAADRTRLTPKITDFGLAKLLDHQEPHTRSGAIVGTPAYMAPEQAEGKHSLISPRADIYALGVILYELLTGRPPFRGESDAATLLQVVRSQFVSLRAARPDAAPDIEAICLKCLEHAPEARYASAAELLDDLQRFLRGEPTRARPLSGRQRAVRWMRKNRRTAALLGATAASLVGITIVSLLAALRIEAARGELRQVALQEKEARGAAELSLAAERAARREAERATAEAAQSRAIAEQQGASAKQVSDFMVELFMTADPLGFAGLGFRRGDEVGMDLPLSELLARGARHAKRTLAKQPLQLATLLDTLGSVYCNLGQPTEAEPLLEEAFRLRQENGAGELDLAASRLSLGVLYRWQNKFPESEQLLRQTLADRERLLGPDDLGVAEAILALGLTLMQRHAFQNDFVDEQSEVLELVQRNERIRIQKLGPRHRDVALAKLLHATTIVGLGDGAATTRLLLEATSILAKQEGGEKLSSAIAELIKAAMIRRNYSSMNHRTAHQRTVEAAKVPEIYRSQIPVLREVLGRRHPLLAMLMLDFAGILRDAGRTVEGISVAREAFTLFDEVGFSASPMLVGPLRDMAYLGASVGEFDEAERYLKQCSEILRGMPDFTGNEKLELVPLYIYAGRYAEADSLLNAYREEYDDLEKLRANPYRFLRTRACEAELAHCLGDLAKARDFLVQLLPNEELRFGKSIMIPYHLIHVCFEMDPDMPFVRETLSTGNIGFGTTVLEDTLGELVKARIHLHYGGVEKAHEIAHHMLTHHRDYSLPESMPVGYAESVMGAVLAAQGKPDEAEPLLKSGLAILRKSRGDHYWLTRQVAKMLIDFYRQAGRDMDAAPYEPLLVPAKL